jgi:phage-related protein
MKVKLILDNLNKEYDINLKYKLTSSAYTLIQDKRVILFCLKKDGYNTFVQYVQAFAEGFKLAKSC